MQKQDPDFHATNKFQIRKNDGTFLQFSSATEG